MLRWQGPEGGGRYKVLGPGENQKFPFAEQTKMEGRSLLWEWAFQKPEGPCSRRTEIGVARSVSLLCRGLSSPLFSNCGHLV